MGKMADLAIPGRISHKTLFKQMQAVHRALHPNILMECWVEGKNVTEKQNG